MSTETRQRQAAKAFAAKWKGQGYEKGQSQPFWIELLQKVLQVEDPFSIISFENRVKLSNTSFIDAYIKPTHVLIEQKSVEIDLKTPIPQSDGTTLTPFRQAKRYADELPYSDRPRWIVICNFREFDVYDMEKPKEDPEIILLENLEKEYYRLMFLVDDANAHIKKELEVSIKAGEIVGVLYDKFLAQYKDPDNEDSQKSLNKLCVRLVFCLYAEDAGIFGSKNMFHDYMERFPALDFRKALIELFQVLDTKPQDRDPYMDEALAAFPYVNGGMFAGDIEIPRITEEIRTLILQRASDNFDWSLISPTIFGAVFESTLNPETRRAGGMHYTSIENIHKVIDPLFLDDLKEELAAIKAEKVAKTQRIKAMTFQDKLAGLKFLDPACGSGNFLTESYTSLRRLENEAIRIIYGGDRVIGEMMNPIKVSIGQFFGIEINDFACAVAQAALWIAESQMMQETDEIVGFNLDPLPLKTYTNIREGNALRIDWEQWEQDDNTPVVLAGYADVYPYPENENQVLNQPSAAARYGKVDFYSKEIRIHSTPKEPVFRTVAFDYIMGNPPFLGARIMTAEQKDDLITVFGRKWKNIGNMDYVTGWYKKAADYMKRHPNTRTALVSTNSITQGEQVANLWKPLMESGVQIDFAWRTFIWDSEASQKAHVHCVIVGFSLTDSMNGKRLYNEDGYIDVANINGYLFDAESIFIEGRTKPICDVPPLLTGCQRIDDDNFVFTDEEKAQFEKKEPLSSVFFRRWYGADEFINNRPRWCLYLGKCSPSELKQMPLCLERVKKVREYRLSSNRIQTIKAADSPNQFGLEIIPEGFFMIVPVVSSYRRNYIPMGFMSPGNICSNQVNLIPDASLFHLGILESSVHMAWVRAVAGRLKSDYRYSKDIVYNNYPWPRPTEAQTIKIKNAAKGILDARTIYPDSSLADLYDPDLMPIELRRAHHANDAAVMEAYGFPKDASESEIVVRLLKMYQELTKQ